MLAAKTGELSCDEILGLIETYCHRVSRETAEVVCGYRQGHEFDFEYLAEAYALSELLADDDPIVAAAR